MRKLLFLGAAVTLLSVTACKKDYTCNCTFDSTGGVADITFEIKKAKKQDAEDTCKATEDTYKLGDPKATCSI
ncbi:MAG: hypothetical protein JKY52_17650 [Flavobacteriales bacterium]|nr:hypothetical protein [Flavobacteriales bacterium]